MRSRDAHGLSRAAGVAAAVVACSVLGLTGSAQAERTAPSGRPPSPSPYGVVNFAGTFADARWRGHIDLSVSSDGRQVTFASGVAPGPCDDRDFGPMLPGRDGATGASFWVERLATPIRADGSFSKQNVRFKGSRGSALSGTFSITGTFAGDVVRGRVDAKAATSYDTCTASVGFAARRVRP